MSNRYTKHKLNEVLLVCVYATITECDSFDAISDWGQAHPEFLRQFLPFHWGVPSGRWLNIMMNRIDPGLFAACFMDWVCACWPEPLKAIAIDGKTVRRSHDRSKGRAALHLVSAFATNSHLVLGQEAVDDKTNETTAIPVLLEKLAAGRSLEGAVVTIDAIACNPQIAQAIRDAGADYLLAVKGNQPTLQADIEAAFDAGKGQVEVDVDHDKGHGRIETRTVSVLRQVDWLDGDRRFPAEVRFVDARAIVRIEARTELKDRSRFDTRYYTTSSSLSCSPASRDYCEGTLSENIELRIDVPSEPQVAVVDGSQLQNVLLDLAINARDTMPRGGELKVEISARGLTPTMPWPIRRSASANMS